MKNKRNYAAKGKYNSSLFTIHFSLLVLLSKSKLLLSPRRGFFASTCTCNCLYMYKQLLLHVQANNKPCHLKEVDVQKYAPARCKSSRGWGVLFRWRRVRRDGPQSIQNRSDDSCHAPCCLQVEAPCDAVHVEQLACEVKSPMPTRFERGEVDALKVYAATGDELLLVLPSAFNLIDIARKNCAKSVPVAFGKLAPSLLGAYVGTLR